ncbi:AGAP003635-PA-like protein [Anopheles sinensis]|uniref:Inositol oxygenase n=1 Tax=Anopheles sinensis TaxID=74873 RepID=A0A084VVY9_ANOSI|nr:AGAP003635-PA-like protein [Anopheles sinensis]
MSERWNLTSALRSGLGASNVATGGSSSNGSTNGIGNNGSAGFAGNSMGGDGGSGTTTFSASNGESGILRKTGHFHLHGGAPENFSDLLVFGYSCKVFRDDERARFIDQGRHLIPWMGDNQLKIDRRYDARGALHDLAPYEPPPGGYHDRLEGLTAAEQKAEQLCEEERYYSLYNNEVEEEYYQEEALKRQALLGNQVPFNYDAPPPQDGAIVATVADRTANSTDAEQDDDPYEPPKNFEIPPDIQLPETMKEHAIIEKTAKFIASQDAQMEILLKTKQSNNPQFEFLTQGARLFRYYRHVLLAFRTNQYPSEVEQPAGGENGTAGELCDAAAAAAPPPTEIRPKIVVPAIKYKPSVDCAYTQLISKITGAPIPTIVADEEVDNQQAEAPVSAQQLTSLNTEFDYYPESSTNSSASVEVKKVSTGLAGLVQYDSESGGSDDESQDNDDKAEKSAKKDTGPFEGLVPPVTIQHVIDRTAIYVAKNGYSFEEALRIKNDPRFVFLNRAHEYYPYYAYLVRQRMTGGGGGGDEIIRLQAPPLPSSSASSPPSSPTKVTIRMETENGTVVETTPSLGIKAVHTAVPKVLPVPVTNIQHQKLGAPVSFSLVVRKAKDDGGSAKVMPGLGGSDDEEDAGDGKVEEDHKKLQPDEGGECPTGDVHGESCVASKDEPPKENVTTDEIASELLDETTVETLEISSLPIVTDLPTAPESIVSKEKQAERKKRANMFINLIKLQPKGAGEDSAVDEKKLLGEEKSAPVVGGSTSDPEEGSIHSQSKSRRSRSRSKHEAGERSRVKKKKSKSRHRGKKKSKKKSASRSRSVSRSRSRSRSRKRARSRSSSSSTAESVGSQRSKRRRRSVSRHSSRTKRTSKRSKRTSRSRSRTPEVRRRRSANRDPSLERKRRKESRRSREPSQTKKRKRRSRSHSSRRKSDSDTENRQHRKHRRGAADGHDGYEARYPPTRGRFLLLHLRQHPNVLDVSELMRPEPKFVDKEVSKFRDYTVDENDPLKERVRRTYKLMHTHQTVDFVKGRHADWLKFDHFKATIREALEKLNDLVDESDPDLDLPNIVHAFQTAERAREEFPELDWLHLTGLIHDLGKVMAFYGEPQWAVVGDTFPVGCEWGPNIVYREDSFVDNPDGSNSKYNTKNGMYEPNCGLEKLTMSWGHDEYLYRVLKHNGSTLPEQALHMIRYHSFYPWHSGGDYHHLTNEKDEQTKQWVLMFNRYDLYTKSTTLPDIDALWPYYQSLIDKYCPGELEF